MNVEKTIEFLLEHQARAELRMERSEKRLDGIDKRLDGITKLMRMGAKAILATDKKVSALTAAQKRTDEKLDALIESQQRTDHALAATNKKFDRLIETLTKKGTNGHRK